jgi:arylsulfatase A-like enzyme
MPARTGMEAAMVMNVIRSWLLLALASTGAVTLASEEAGGASRTNVLFVIADDLRPWLASYGFPKAVTPHLDRLAAEGMVFDRAYVQQAWCSPSRTSVFSGRRPDVTRVYDLVTHFRDTLPEAVTLPQYFRSRGYVTARLGKVFHEGMDDPASWSVPEPAGLPKGGTYFYGTKENVEYAANNRAKPRYASPTEKGPDTPGLYPDDLLTAEAVAFLRAHRDDPFFLALGFYKPHLPFTAPQRHWDLYDRREMAPRGPAALPAGAPACAFLASTELDNYRGLTALAGAPLPDEVAAELIHGYLACVSFIDEQVGRLMAALDELGLRQNTVVVFWGDHGWKLGEYGQWSKNSNFEVDTRVPLVVAGPGIRRGVRTAAIVESLDLYPTLAELAGLPVPPEIEGRSFSALLRGDRETHKDAAYSQVIRNDRRGYTTYALATEMGQSVRTARFRFVRWLRRGEHAPFAFELYDHENDPGETVNVAGRVGFAAARQELEALVDGTFLAPFVSSPRR